MNRTPHRYSAEDVQEILASAASLEPQAAFSEEQLREMASELNISPEVLQQAEQDWRRQKNERQERARITRKRQGQFREHLGVYVAVNAGMFLLDWTIDGDITWAFYPLLAWGLGLVLDGISANSAWNPSWRHWSYRCMAAQKRQAKIR